MKIFVFTVSFFLVVGVIGYINYKLNHEFKIEVSWMALALSPFIIWLIATGQVAQFSGFGVDLKLKQISEAPVSIEIEGDMINAQAISVDEKRGVDQIPRLINEKIGAINLRVGVTGYYNNRAIRQYLSQLTKNYFFKYVVFTDQEGIFLGLSEANRVLFEMESSRRNIVEILESKSLEKMPGVIDVYISKDTSKSQALKLMDQKDLSVLPVVNHQREFIGVVERGKITTSIVAQLVSSRN